MRIPLVVGNWKLNGSLAENESRLLSTVEALREVNQVDVGLCLPYPYLFQAQQLLSNTPVMWGAQNVSQFEQGAYTSCVSAQMVAEFGCQLAILGHSERRIYSAENSAKATVRIKRALDAGITPIYCIGETQAEHAVGDAKSVIETLVLALFDLDTETLKRMSSNGIVIAYEPIWAIGAEYPATIEQAQNMHAWIRGLLANYDAKLAENTRIIYGGSLKPDNAKVLFDMPDIDGGLVGRASLNPHSFAQICIAATDQRSN